MDYFNEFVRSKYATTLISKDITGDEDHLDRAVWVNEELQAEPEYPDYEYAVIIGEGTDPTLAAILAEDNVECSVIDKTCKDVTIRYVDIHKSDLAEAGLIFDKPVLIIVFGEINFELCAQQIVAPHRSYVKILRDKDGKDTYEFIY